MGRHRKKKSGLPSKVHTFVAVVVSAVWGGTFVMEIIRPGFEAPEELGAITLLVFGAVFGAEQVKTALSSGRDEESDDRSN